MVKEIKKACRFSPGKDAPLKHKLIELFWVLGPAFTRWAESQMHQQGLTPQRMRLMALLLDNGPMMMSALKDELGVTATNVTALVDVLEKDHMVVRKAHPSDRRATLIEITPRAEKRINESCAEFKDKVSGIFSIFSKNDQEQFVSLMQRMREALIDRDILEECEHRTAESK